MLFLISYLIAKHNTYDCLSLLIHAGANDASAQARKALKKQRREQRERQHQERQQQRDFRLERRKPQPDRQHNMRTQEHYPSSVHSHHSTDQRLPPYPNPQFAKWIMEQNPRYYSGLVSHQTHWCETTQDSVWSFETYRCVFTQVFSLSLG